MYINRADRITQRGYKPLAQAQSVFDAHPEALDR